MAYEPNEFGYKDFLESGNPDKVIKGGDFDVEFNAIKEALDSIDVDVNVDDVNGLEELLDDKADKSDLEQEIQHRISGDAALQGQIDNFENYDDSEIKADLATETQQRKQGDAALGVRIDGVESDLSQEITDRQNGDNALGDRIDNLVTDDLADVNSAGAKVDQFLIHNGSQWVAEDFHIDTELTYQGGISVPNDPAPTAANGDLYINNENGTAGASWKGIAGLNINAANAVGWSQKNNRWYMLGDIASAAVMRVEAGLGIDVDDTKPAEPVVSIDRTETDKWYARLWKQSGDDIYYDDGNVGIGASSTKSRLTVEAPTGDYAILLTPSGDTTGTVTKSYIGFDVRNSASNNREPAAYIGVEESGVNSVQGQLVFATRQTNNSTVAPTEAMRIAGNGNVGIGMEPTRSTFDLSAKEQLKEWKTKAKKASWPVVTEGAFEQEPTEDLVAQWIETRAAGDRLQVNGNISVTGNMTAYGYTGGPGRAGIRAGSLAMTPMLDGASETDKVSFGSSAYKWSDAYFSGTVSANQLVANLDVTAGRNAQITGTVYGGAVESYGLLRSGKGANEFSASSVAAGVQLAAYDRVNAQYTQMHLRADNYKFSVAGSTNSAFLLDASGTASFSGTVNAANFSGRNFYRLHAGGAGLRMTNTKQIFPLDGTGEAIDGEIDFGDASWKFKDAYFSGSVNATTINGTVTDVGDHIKAITPTQIANWDAGTGGDSGGAITDPRITDENIIHWNEAWNWGNHNDANYQPAGDYETAGTAYSKSQSDNKYMWKGDIAEGRNTGEMLSWTNGGWAVDPYISTGADTVGIGGTKSFEVYAPTTFAEPVQVNGNLTATKFIKYGGTADQVLCANGTVTGKGYSKAETKANVVMTEAQYNNLGSKDANTIYFLT